MKNFLHFYLIRDNNIVMLQKNYGLLKLCSRLVKISAWTFLLLGVFSGVGTIFGLGQNIPRWMGVPIILVYVFAFFLVYLIALIADLCLDIWQFLKKERI